MVFDTSLFHDPVCNVPDADFSVYSDIPIAYRTVPDVMVALSMPHEIAPIFLQDMADFFFRTPPLCHDRLGFHFEYQVDPCMGHIVDFQHFRRGQFYSSFF